MIDRGWSAALRHCADIEGPRLLYFSYADADGSAERINLDDIVFRPLRGLWFLSGYVLSRKGAATLLRAMPVIGPVDMWMNFRFEALGALALHSPVILQRQDTASDNAYSILPYLARAGTVDAGAALASPNRETSGSVLAWTAGGSHEGLAMALSMLGLRVRVYDGDEEDIQANDLPVLLGTFDAIVDAPLAPSALSSIITNTEAKFLLELAPPFGSGLELLPHSRTLILSRHKPSDNRWLDLCAFLGLNQPAEAFPVGAARSLRVFRDDRPSLCGKPMPIHSDGTYFNWILRLGSYHHEATGDRRPTSLKWQQLVANVWRTRPRRRASLRFGHSSKRSLGIEPRRDRRRGTRGGRATPHHEQARRRRWKTLPLWRFCLRGGL